MNDEQQWPTYRPDATPDRETPAKATTPPAEPALPTHTTPGRSSRRRDRDAVARRNRIIGITIVVVVPLVIVSIIVLAILGSTGTGPFKPPDVLSEEGLAELRADVQERTGDTEVFGATLYPGYAVLDVPVDDTTYREEGLYWDGGFDDFGGKGTADGERIDLATVDAAVVERLIAQVKTYVEDPETWYVIIDGPPKPDYPIEDDGVRISAYASNEFSESASIAATLDGEVVRENRP